MRDMIQTIYISSKLAKLHSHDLLDQKNIEKGLFFPNFTFGRITEAIAEIIKIVRISTVCKNVEFNFNAGSINTKFPYLLFDRRRLQ